MNLKFTFRGPGANKLSIQPGVEVHEVQVV